MSIDGRTLIAWGLRPEDLGPKFKEALDHARDLYAKGFETGAIQVSTHHLFGPHMFGGEGDFPDKISMRAHDELPFTLNIEADNELEEDNIRKVSEHMVELMRVPTVVAGTVLPDSCPSDSRLGYIPVGGVVATKEAIHPGFHSADVCCSMAISIFKDKVDPKDVLDIATITTHFGVGGRDRGKQWKPSSDLIERIRNNFFLRDKVSLAIEHMGTQGDGNHFFFVGRIASTGDLAIVTHHGSRGLGAFLYKQGMVCANKYRLKLAPDVPDYNAWIPSEGIDGKNYWEALQIVREWTKQNHYSIHDEVLNVLGLQNYVVYRFWNEHNFVFRRSDGLFYHAKGATPAYKGFSADDSGLTLIPLNMAQPILITKGLDNPKSLGFSPHGAGRNMSRSDYMRRNSGKTMEEMIAEQAPGIDIRYFSKVPDSTELPWAYKNADSVRSQITKFGLAEVTDTVEPIGNLMAGRQKWDIVRDKKRAEKKAARLAAEQEENLDA